MRSGNRVASGRIFDPKFIECESTKSSVDDLILGRGDVSSRAAFTLRDTESQPHLTWRFEHHLCAHFPHYYSLFGESLQLWCVHDTCWISSLEENRLVLWIMLL